MFKARRGATWTLGLHSLVKQGFLADQGEDGGIKMQYVSLPSLTDG